MLSSRLPAESSLPMNKKRTGFFLLPVVAGLLTACLSLAGILACYATIVRLYWQAGQWHKGAGLAWETVASFHLGKEISDAKNHELEIRTAEQMLPVQGNLRLIKIQVFSESVEEPLFTVVTYD